MTYTSLKELIGNNPPTMARNQDNESVFITQGYTEGLHWYKTETAQDNGRLRSNIYYADGTTEELFDM